MKAVVRRWKEREGDVCADVRKGWMQWKMDLVTARWKESQVNPRGRRIFHRICLIPFTLLFWRTERLSRLRLEVPKIFSELPRLETSKDFPGASKTWIPETVNFYSPWDFEPFINWDL
jgi:hypothetical protein